MNFPCECGRRYSIKPVPSDYVDPDDTQPSGEILSEGLSISEPTRKRRSDAGVRRPMSEEQMRCKYIDGNSNLRCEARSKGPIYRFRCPEHL